MLPYVIDRDGLDRDGLDRDGLDGLLAKLPQERVRHVAELLGRHGAVLLRNHNVDGVDGLNRFVCAFAGSGPLAYVERSSPRSTISGRVYTSTDYPATEEIFLHNENSYQAVWPMTLFFYCVAPPDSQGSTTLADVRSVLKAIDPAVREEFERRRWMVVRNYHPDFGARWQHVYNTEDRNEVAAHCRRNGIVVDWRGADGLRTSAVRDAVHRHPRTDEAVWFNHATFFHNTTLDPDVRAGLLEIFDEKDLPTNTYYGDGGRIPDEVMNHLRECYRSSLVRFDWQRDDVLLVDNMLAAHGREPYTGQRRIAVAMANPSVQPIQPA